MVRCLYIAVLICGLSAVVIAGCARREEQVVAEVFGEKIRVREVEEAYAKLPAGEREGATQALWTLIDQKLLIGEARKQGLEDSMRVQRGLKEAEVSKVLDTHRQRLAKGIEVSEEEMRRYFEEEGLDARTEVRACHIMAETREEAEDVLKALEEGVDFAELARERSIDEVSAAKGGDLGYWERGTVIGATARKVFSMHVGEISEPFRSERGYHIIQVMDERPVGFERQKPRIERSLRAMKIAEKGKAYAEGLKEKYSVRMNEEALALLLHTEGTTGHIPRLASQAYSMPLLTFDGGTISLGQYVGWVTRLKPRRRPVPDDSVQVVQFAEQIVLSTVLLPRSLREAGLYEMDEVRAYLTNKRDELMVKELRRMEVEEKVITNAAIEDYYQAHREDYFEPDAIQVEAMWSETMEKAHKAFREIQAGAEMAQVARILGAPSDEWENYEVFRFHPSDEEQERLGIVREAEKTEVGQLGGPVRVSIVRRGQPILRYSVFRVLNRIPARQRSLEEPSVQASIRRRLRISRKADIEREFQSFILELRKRYADQIHTYEQTLELVSLPAQEGGS